MLNETKALINKIEEVEKDVISKISLDMIEEVSTKDFKTIKNVYEALNLSKSVMVKQAEMLTEMNEKLDKILSKMEES